MIFIRDQRYHRRYPHILQDGRGDPSVYLSHQPMIQYLSEMARRPKLIGSSDTATTATIANLHWDEWTQPGVAEEPRVLPSRLLLLCSSTVQLPTLMMIVGSQYTSDRPGELAIRRSVREVLTCVSLSALALSFGLIQNLNKALGRPNESGIIGPPMLRRDGDLEPIIDTLP